MCRKTDRPRTGEGGGGEGEGEYRIAGGWRNALAAIFGVWALTGAQADPAPVIEKGLPATAIPTYQEKGAPQFTYPSGGAGAGSGGSTVGGGEGSGGGGYSGGGGDGPGTIAHGYAEYEGRVAGNGECVALAQATSNVGHTSTWVPGERVQGATDIAPGTVIATFGENGTYTNTPGQSHTAIYLGQDDRGIQVVDQWVGQPAHVRWINWSTNNSYESGSKFYVVSH